LHKINKKPFSSSTAEYSIVSLRHRSVDYPQTLHCAQIAIDLVKCCTNEISCTHRLQKIRGKIAGDWMLWSTVTTKDKWYFWLMEVEIEIIFLQKWKARMEFI